MKKMTLALAIVSAFAAVSTAQAADVTAQALATRLRPPRKTPPANWL